MLQKTLGDSRNARLKLCAPISHQSLPIEPRVLPQFERDGQRIDVDLLPPYEFVAASMELAMMEPAKRYGEFVTDFARERTLLSKPEVMFNSVRKASRFLSSIVRGEMPTQPERVELSATMPTEEPEHAAEAMRRALPELVKLDRYESRAAARRDRAIQGNYPE